MLLIFQLVYLLPTLSHPTTTSSIWSSRRLKPSKSLGTYSTEPSSTTQMSWLNVSSRALASVTWADCQACPSSVYTGSSLQRCFTSTKHFSCPARLDSVPSFRHSRSTLSASCVRRFRGNIKRKRSPARPLTRRQKPMEVVFARERASET